MPCTYYTPEEERAIIGHQAREQAKLINKLTEILCIVCKEVDETPNSPKKELKSITKLQLWWKAHQKKDRERILKEAADFAAQRKREKDIVDEAEKKKKILNKLTSKERKILGLP